MHLVEPSLSWGKLPAGDEGPNFLPCGFSRSRGQKGQRAQLGDGLPGGGEKAEALCSPRGASGAVHGFWILGCHQASVFRGAARGGPGVLKETLSCTGSRQGRRGLAWPPPAEPVPTCPKGLGGCQCRSRQQAPSESPPRQTHTPPRPGRHPQAQEAAAPLPPYPALPTLRWEGAQSVQLWPWALTLTLGADPWGDPHLFRMEQEAAVSSWASRRRPQGWGLEAWPRMHLQD